MTVPVWADVDLIHLSIAGARIKSLRSHLTTADLARLAAGGAEPAGPPPLPPGAATRPNASSPRTRTGERRRRGRSGELADVSRWGAPVLWGLTWLAPTAKGVDTDETVAAIQQWLDDRDAAQLDNTERSEWWSLTRPKPAWGRLQ